MILFPNRCNLNHLLADLASASFNASKIFPVGKAAKEIVVRFHHATTASIKCAKVIENEWKNFSKEKDYIILSGQIGTVTVTAPC